MGRLALLLLLAASPAVAQSGPATGRSPKAPALAVRAFADAGIEILHAVDAFDTVFDRNAAARFGGGLMVSLPHGLFADIRASRLQMTGQRAFVFNGQAYPLGVADTLTVIPIQLTGGLRPITRGGRAVPYLGGGVGWYRASERSAFSSPDEVAERMTAGYHLLGGADVRLWGPVGLGGEVEWSQVIGGLSGSGVASALSDTNLGGVSIRMRVLVGRW